MKHKCPICHKTLKPLPEKQDGEPGFFPFCSERCRLIDLGGWLDAEYKIISKLPNDSSDTSPNHHQQDPN
ncbi:MAG: DNA gyrase inhibitor YacG [Planctomycetota bacterium]